VRDVYPTVFLSEAAAGRAHGMRQATQKQRESAAWFADAACDGACGAAIRELPGQGDDVGTRLATARLILDE